MEKSSTAYHQARLKERPDTTRKEECLSIHDLQCPIGNAVQPRLENPRRNVIDPASRRHLRS